VLLCAINTSEMEKKASFFFFLEKMLRRPPSSLDCSKENVFCVTKVEMEPG
jgi:hypothetical protein